MRKKGVFIIIFNFELGISDFRMFNIKTI